MIIKPEYSGFRRRILTGLLKFTLLPIICMALVVFYRDWDKEGTIFFACLFGAMGLSSIFSVFKTNKRYLNEIRFVGEYCEFEISEYGKSKEVHKTGIADTKIEMRKIIFSTNFGRSYKLVIETKQGLTYKKIIQQYEVGNWTADEFKRVLMLYRETRLTVARINHE